MKNTTKHHSKIKNQCRRNFRKKRINMHSCVNFSIGISLLCDPGLMHSPKTYMLNSHCTNICQNLYRKPSKLDATHTYIDVIWSLNIDPRECWVRVRAAQALSASLELRRRIIVLIVRETADEYGNACCTSHRQDPKTHTIYIQYIQTGPTHHASFRTLATAPTAAIIVWHRWAG